MTRTGGASAGSTSRRLKEETIMVSRRPPYVGAGQRKTPASRAGVLRGSCLWRFRHLTVYRNRASNPSTPTKGPTKHRRFRTRPPKPVDVSSRSTSLRAVLGDERQKWHGSHAPVELGHRHVASADRLPLQAHHPQPGRRRGIADEDAAHARFGRAGEARGKLSSRRSRVRPICPPRAGVPSRGDAQPCGPAPLSRCLHLLAASDLGMLV